METYLGERIADEAACDSCQEKGLECWIYSKFGIGQIKNHGSGRARYRFFKIRCSLSTRTKMWRAFMVMRSRL
jgi:hypothetical protein